MDSLQNSTELESFKKELVEGLRKYHEHLSTKILDYKMNVNEAEAANEAVFNKIQYAAYNSVAFVANYTAVEPNRTCELVATRVPQLKNKLEQLRAFKHTIAAKFDARSCHQAYYKMLTSEEVFLKPYDEVEEITKVLQQKIDRILQKCEEEKNNCLENQEKRKHDFLQLKNVINNCESIEKEESLEVKTLEKNLEEKLNRLKLNSSLEATMDNFETNELLKQISDLKSELAKD